MSAKGPPRWLTFTGVAGCGKTMLARQIFAQARSYSPGNVAIWHAGEGYYREENRRPECVWLEAAVFSSRMKEGEYDLPEYLKPDWIVCLDDLGASRDKSDFIADGIYRFCNARLGRWTLFTTNLTLEELADRIDQRVVSRLIRDQNAVCQIKAGDYAMK